MNTEYLTSLKVILIVLLTVQLYFKYTSFFLDLNSRAVYAKPLEHFLQTVRVEQGKGTEDPAGNAIVQMMSDGHSC